MAKMGLRTPGAFLLAGMLLGLGTLRTADGACCYFSAKDADVLQPAQKAFLTWDGQGHMETFTVQPRFEGNALDFGMVIPTPARPKLDEMPRDFFKDLAIYTILMPLPACDTHSPDRRDPWKGIQPAPIAARVNTPTAGAGWRRTVPRWRGSSCAFPS